MIKIAMGDKELIVTKGAFENFFKPLGYEIKVNPNKDKNIKDAKIVTNEKASKEK